MVSHIDRDHIAGMLVAPSGERLKALQKDWDRRVKTILERPCETRDNEPTKSSMMPPVSMAPRAASTAFVAAEGRNGRSRLCVPGSLDVVAIAVPPVRVHGMDEIEVGQLHRTPETLPAVRG